MCAKRTNSTKPTTYTKKHTGRVLSTDEKRKITQSKQVTKSASNPFDSFTQKRHMSVKGQRNQTVKLSQAHTRDLQSRRDTLLVELRNKERSSNFINRDDGTVTTANNNNNYNNNNGSNRVNSAANYIALATASASAASASQHNNDNKNDHFSSSSKSTKSTLSSNPSKNVKLDADQKKLYEKSLQKLQKRDLKRKRFTLDEDDDDENDGDDDNFGDFDGHVDDNNKKNSSSSKNKKQKESNTTTATTGGTTFGATLGDIDEAFDRNMMKSLNGGDDYDNDGDDAYGDGDGEDDVQYRNEFAERANRRLEKLQALENKPRTNEDRYLEIIRKSKLHKMERQKKREELMDVTDEMNDNFNMLLTHLSMRPKKEEREDDEDDEENEELTGDGDDAYDRAIRSFSFQPKLTPDVVKKTDLETAEERKQRLQRMDEERLERMNSAANAAATSLVSNGKKGSGVEALEYDEYLSDNEEDIGSDDEIDPTVRLGVPDDDDEEVKASDNEGDDEGEKQQQRQQQKPQQEVQQEIGADIPYVIEAPTNYAELKQLLEGRSPAEVSIIFSRIRELNDARLGHEQKLKLQNFFSLAIKHYKSYVHHIEKSPEYANGERNVDFSMLNALYDHIFGMAEVMPKHAVSEFKNHLRAMHVDLLNRVSSHSETHDGYPGACDLLFLKLISNIFPVTDFQHAITTPANIYIHQCLADCELRSLRDVAAGLFLCSMAIHYNHEAKRFSPEVVQFLTKLLTSVTAKSDVEEGQESSSSSSNSDQDTKRINWLRLKKVHLKQLPATSESSSAASLLSFNKFIMNRPSLDQKLSLVQCAIQITKQYCSIFNHELVNYVDVFTPIKDALQAIQDKCFAQLTDHVLHAQIQNVISHVTAVSDKCVATRKRLLYLEVKPQAIPQFTPLVIGTLKGKIVDDDKFRLHNKIMTQKVRRAQRSAIREIRKDNAFLARAREEVVANEMKQRKEKYKEIINDLQSEKHQQYQLDFGNRQLAKDMKAARKSRKSGNQSTKDKKKK